jgi:xylan 1,4-beta-xylosidase
MANINNPILPGFNPDPSILRVGDDYYIATSTFEWFPGVQIHHSRDLVHWRLAGRPLDRLDLLDMRGNPNSCGIWAPCLTHDGELFHLCYTDVKTLDCQYKDTHNYLTTAPAVEGPWSPRVYLNSSGFDPSMFHDDDGCKWLLNMLWDHREHSPTRFAGIVAQRYDPRVRRLVGPATNIFRGSPLGVTEGPHLYKRGGWYYLITAEGGTGLDHAVTVARSRDLLGPYEVHPENPVLTSRGKPHLRLQKAGHGCLVQTPGGQWYMTHLASRPLGPHGRSILGRETCIQPITWGDDGWPRLAAGGNDPQDVVAAPDLPPAPLSPPPIRDDFDSPQLGIHFQTLRTPADESWLSLTQRPGFLRLRGRESLASMNEQSLVARRVQSLDIEAATCLEFTSTSFQQMAGLVAFYDTNKHYYLCVSFDEKLGKCLGIISMVDGRYGQPLAQDVSVHEWDKVYLRLVMRGGELRFFYGRTREHYEPIGEALDATVLSDEYGRGHHFTGAMVGMACQDLSGGRLEADFDWFDYREL